MPRLTLTYGQMPTEAQWADAWHDTELRGGRYHITLGRSDSEAMEGFRLGDGAWDCFDLYSACMEVVTKSDADQITVSEDDEQEDVYQVFYPGTDRPFIEIGPDDSSLIEWAERFGTDPHANHDVAVSRARAALNYAAAHGSVGNDWTRQDTRMDVVSSILETLGVEWI